MVSFLTGSLGDFLDRNYESEKVKTLFLANNVYGKHGGPYAPGTALGLLFHLLSGGEHELQGFYGHVLGGMGAITQAMAAAARELRRRDPDVGARRADLGRGRDGRAASCSRTARRSTRGSWSPTPTRSARSSGWSARTRCPRSSGARSRASRWTGPARRSTSCSPRSRASHGDARRISGSPSAPSSRSCRRSSSPSAATRIARAGEIPGGALGGLRRGLERGPVASRREGRHVMTCFVQYVPYRLKRGTWDEKRELLGDRVVREDRRVRAERPRRRRRAAGPDAARPRADLRPDRGQHLPRRPLARAALLPAAGGRLRALPDADRGPLPLRRRRASGRRRHGRARPQRVAPGPARLEAAGSRERRARSHRRRRRSWAPA